MTCIGSWPDKCPECGASNGGGYYCDACKQDKLMNDDRFVEGEALIVHEDDLEETQTDN